MTNELVTYGLVGTVTACCLTFFAVISWLNKTFQTREAAKEQMKAINEKFDVLAEKFIATDLKMEERFRVVDQKVEGLHSHLKHVNSEFSDRFKQLMTTVETNQRSVIEIQSNVSFMKGRMFRKTEEEA